PEDIRGGAVPVVMPGEERAAEAVRSRRGELASAGAGREANAVRRPANRAGERDSLRVEIVDVGRPPAIIPAQDPATRSVRNQCPEALAAVRGADGNSGAEWNPDVRSRRIDTLRKDIRDGVVHAAVGPSHDGAAEAVGHDLRRALVVERVANLNPIRGPAGGS